MTSEILNSNFDLDNIKYPKNIYAVRIFDDKNNSYEISVQHNGYCPIICNDRDQSQFNDYLSNLYYEVVDEYFKSIKKRTPKNYNLDIEVMTDSEGELYHLSKAIN